ncbi:hypothetical protein [Curtobacterium sp. MCJR17_043]|uniref:hypothetical protein n=1 Tax=Curtobacterium sp. MCJR17_043 TaxID=2175660 RepID=UPI0032E87138
MLAMSVVGVTTIAPSIRVPARRESDRRSQPGRASPADESGVGEQFVAGAVGGRRDALEELGGERLELRDEDADDVGAAAPEAPGDEGALVPE